MRNIISIIRNIYTNYKIVLDNLFSISFLQLFGIIAPLITYPYLVSVLGLELYGIVITAQVLVSYASIVIDYGSNTVCPREVSIYRNDRNILSEIVCSVITTRTILCLFSFLIYLLVVMAIPIYREHLNLFLFSYLLTMNELFFPQFFFQGIEKMKVISLLNVLVKIVFIALVFLFVRNADDYILVPILYATGYTIAGLVSLWIVFHKYKIEFKFPSVKKQFFYFKECLPILATDLICTIKDKFNYMFIGSFVGMSNVVVYDLGLKFISIISRPSNIITMVFLPRFAQNRCVGNLKKLLIIVFFISLLLIILMNIYLKPIVSFFINYTIDLLPLRLFSIVPLFLCPGVVIANNFFIGFGHNKYVFYSIVITTIVYISLLLLFWILGYSNNIYSYIYIAIMSYLVEFVYRYYIFYKKTK